MLVPVSVTVAKVLGKELCSDDQRRSECGTHSGAPFVVPTPPDVITIGRHSNRM